MKRILVATDGSSSAKRAVNVAAGLAKAKGCDLVIMTIGGQVTGEELRRIAQDGGDLSKAMTAASDQILKDAAGQAHRHGITKPKLRCEWGDPAEAIIAVIRRVRPEFIVLGRRGRGRLSGLLLGSVSQKVVTLAPCPVMIVP